MLWLSTLLLLIGQVGYEGLLSRLRPPIVADLMVSHCDITERQSHHRVARCDLYKQLKYDKLLRNIWRFQKLFISLQAVNHIV